MDTSTLTTAVCALLDAAGVGEWRPAGPAYTAAETGIFYGALGALPDKAIGVTCYTATDDIVTGLATRRVQVRCRGARNVPNGADLIADAVFAAIHGLYRTSGFARITREFPAPLGADGNSRQERTDNYLLVLDNE